MPFICQIEVLMGRYSYPFNYFTYMLVNYKDRPSVTFVFFYMIDQHKLEYTKSFMVCQICLHLHPALSLQNHQATSFQDLVY